MLTSLFAAGINIPKMNVPSNGPLTTPMTVNEPWKETRAANLDFRKINRWSNSILIFVSDVLIQLSNNFFFFFTWSTPQSNREERMATVMQPIPYSNAVKKKYN